MPSSYSTNLKIELQATGENSGTWGTITNTNLGTALEQAIVGYGNPSYASDANLTLTYTDTNAAQAARALVLNVTSAVSLSATRELVVPTIQKQYIVQNNTTGAQSITVKTSGGTGITVPNGRKAHLYVDGTNVIYMDDYVDINGGAIDGTPIGANSASTGAFTTLSASGNITVSGGTANGVLYLNASKVATSGSALVFDGSGLGVGNTAAANTRITVRTAAQTDAAFAADNGVNTGFRVQFAANLTSIGNDFNNPLVFLTNNTERMRLDSSGNLGIGTSSPVSKLTVEGGSSSQLVLQSNGTNSTNKESTVSARHYTNAEEPVALVGGFSISNANEVYVGGGFNTGNAATLISFYTAANNTTVTGTERMRLDSSGNLGIGTSSPATKLQVNGVTTTAGVTSSGPITIQSTSYFIGNAANGYRFNNAADTLNLMRLTDDGNLGLGVTPSAWGSSYTAFQVKNGSIASTSGEIAIAYNKVYTTGDKYIANGYATQYIQNNNGQHVWYNAASGTAGNAITFTQTMTLTAAGNLGIGTSSPQADTNYGGLTINGSSGSILTLRTGDANTARVYATADGINIDSNGSASTDIRFRTGTSSTERARITSGGNFGIGTTSPGTLLQVTSSVADTDIIRITNGIQQLNLGTNNTNGGSYVFEANAYALRFGTNNTERARITSGGDLLVAKTGSDTGTVGCELRSTGIGAFTAASNIGIVVNRTTSDGDLVLFRQDNADEGSISVSGNTVSYNSFAGSHWSQLQDGSKPDILRGTVMESINELCEWPGEQNERLPKAKISDTAGSKKVYGVFMAWDNDWTTTNDMYVTAVGAFICRVNGSVTVQEGDLLESNGDGTARVQADDIIRSSTIGKVTSTVKTHEYDDGSYCVPTVLYCG